MSEDDVPSVTLYPEAMAMAVATVVYTTGSALAAGFTHILFRLNGKQVVYVSLLSLSIFLQQLFTITHELLNLLLWPQLQVEVYEEYLSQWRNPNASIAYETSPNLALRVIFAIRTYFFNVESLLFFFWSLMLFVSVWEVQNRALKSDRFIIGSKWICFLLPAGQVAISNLPQVKRRVALHLALGNCTMITTCTLGSIFLLLILVKCVHVMWSASWTHKVRQWRAYDNGCGRRRRGGNLEQRPGTTRSVNSTVTTSSTSDSEDRYILVRFIAGFLIIGGLQTSFLLSQYFYAASVLQRRSPDAEKPHLGWTLREQLSDWSYFLASGSTGYLILIVFGTTRESRRQARRLMVSFSRRDGEYVSFRASTTTTTTTDYDYDDDEEEEQVEQVEQVQRQGMRQSRRRSPPSNLAFVSSRITPMGSGGGGGGGGVGYPKASPAFSIVDLKTPAKSVHHER